MRDFTYAWWRYAVGLVLLVAGVTSMLSFGLQVGTVVKDPRPEILPPHPGVAVVASLRETGGWSLFGVRIADRTRLVEVRFLTDPGCSRLLRSGDPWPTSAPQCPSPVEVVGTVRGLGVTPSGDTLVGVEFEVPRACFDLLERGVAWPTTDAACPSNSHHDVVAAPPSP